ncbi:hypothetical protein KM043_015750 [Ampulex compressa]|nr:hypothetical protein KM043_015750 [Ampulex compressa]
MALEIIGTGITKFDGSDFQTWQFEIKQLFIAHGLKDVVDGSRTKSAGENADAAVQSWIKDNTKAMSVISSSLDREQLRGLTTCTMAKDMWGILTSIYERKSASSKLLLLQKYHKYRMKQDESVVQHVTNVQKLASQLKHAGQKVTEVDMMVKIFGSLPQQFSTLAMAWDNVPVAQQSIAVLLERFIKELTRMTVEDNATSALTAQGKSSNSCSINNGKGKKYEWNFRS